MSMGQNSPSVIGPNIFSFIKLVIDIKSTQRTNTRTCRLETYENYEEAHR